MRRPLLREWKGRSRGRPALFGFAAAVVIALAGLGFAKNRDKAKLAATAPQDGDVLIQPATPAAEGPEVTLQEPVVTPVATATVLSATLDERAPSFDAPRPARTTAQDTATASERFERVSGEPAPSAATSSPRPSPDSQPRPPTKTKRADGLDLLNPY